MNNEITENDESVKEIYQLLKDLKAYKGMLENTLARQDDIINNLTKELEQERKKQTKFTETVRAVEGLGGIIHKIELRDLFVMAALSGLCANPAMTKPKGNARDVGQWAHHVGIEAYEFEYGGRKRGSTFTPPGHTLKEGDTVKIGDNEYTVGPPITCDMKMESDVDVSTNKDLS